MSQSTKTINILGMDPSMNNWGIAAAKYHKESSDIQVVHLSTVSPTSVQTGNKRHMDIASQLYTRLLPYLNGADCICVEAPTGSKDFNAAVSYAVCCTLIGILQTKGIPVFTVSPKDVKRVVGNPEATKKDIVEWVAQRHPEAPIPMYNGKHNVTKANHCCDAVVAIHAALSTPKLNHFIENHYGNSH